MEEKKYDLIFFCYTLFHAIYPQIGLCACIISLNDALEFESYDTIYPYYYSQIC